MLANTKILMIVAAVMGMTGIAADSGSAQVRRYQPNRPTISHYQNLNRLQTTPVPNYYSFVRPIQRQRALDRQQQAFNQQQTRSLQQLQRDVQQGLQQLSGTGQSSGFMIPSTRSAFGTAGGYFQTNTGGVGIVP